MEVPDNSFVKITSDPNICFCENPLPVSVGSDIRFVANFWFSTYSVVVNITDINGNVLFAANNAVTYNGTTFIIDLKNTSLNNFNVGDCFRIKLYINVPNIAEETMYSTTFLYIGNETNDTLSFEYWGKVPKDDYWYFNSKDEHMKIRLWSILDKPQAKTDKTEYTDSTGYVRSLAKTRRQEFDLNFDFYPEDAHLSIQEMLTYPNLLVDGVQMYESGDYEILWDEQDENNKAKATTSLSEQDILRYSISD